MPRRVVRALVPSPPPPAQVTGRKHIDLRRAGALDRFKYVSKWRLRDTFVRQRLVNLVQSCLPRSPAEIDMVYFLACEVGGSKYLYGDEKQAQIEVLRHNMQIYEVVWPWIQEHALKAVFVSSQLQAEATPYGAVKRLGEAWAAQVPTARTVRLWNVYGREREGVKSHVINDWVVACLRHGEVHALTNGKEARQFLHTLDAADAFVSMAEAWDIVPSVVDLTTGQWTPLTALASSIQLALQESGRGNCTFHWAAREAKGNIRRRAPVLSSAFHLHHLGVWSHLQAAGVGAQVEADIDAFVAQGRHHVLGSRSLLAGVKQVIQEILDESQKTLPSADQTEL